MIPSKLTPAEAWEMAKRLHSDACFIYLYPDGRGTTRVMTKNPANGFENTHKFSNLVDWPDGVDGVERYPLPEPEKKWRNAVWPRDWNKPCRVKSLSSKDSWSDDDLTEGIIIGYDSTEQRWIVRGSDNGTLTMSRWPCCQVIAEEDVLEKTAAAIRKKTRDDLARIKEIRRQVLDASTTDRPKFWVFWREIGTGKINSNIVTAFKPNDTFLLDNGCLHRMDSCFFTEQQCKDFYRIEEDEGEEDCDDIEWDPEGPQEDKNASKKYLVYIDRITRATIDVRADSEEEAREVAKAKWLREHALPVVIRAVLEDEDE